jgi:lipopolysaccharide biosynthesis glycosyltransferase
MPDQDVLNVVFADNYTILPKQYNLVVDLSVQYLTLKKFIDNIKGCFVLHYTGGNDVRPWIKEDVPCKHYFWKFAKKTDFYQDLKYELLLNQFKFINNQGKHTLWFLLFNFLPILKMKEKNEIKRYYLLGFIPILQIKNR